MDYRLFNGNNGQLFIMTDGCEVALPPDIEENLRKFLIVNKIDREEKRKIAEEERIKKLLALETEAYQTSWQKTTSSGREPEVKEGPAPAPINPETGMHKDYWVLPEAERAKGFIRPLRYTYIHVKCGSSTRMGNSIAETYARNNLYYGSTFCCNCGGHFPVGENGEFVWEDGTKVGT